jgi:predicted metal-dependent hydrolase
MSAAVEIHTLNTGREFLAYTVRRSHRRRTVAIHVEPDQRVTVLIPAAASMQRVEDLLRRRLAWVRRRQRTFGALPPAPPPRQWIAGETHRYLGRQYRLKVCSGQPESVRMSGGYFVVTVADNSHRSSIQRLLTGWYREHAVVLLDERVRKALASTTWLEVDPPRISVRKLAQRWGSTTRTGHVTFNIELVQLPLPCIDYVVTHELVHLRIPDHSPAFWRMLGRIMPDWRKWQERLSRQVA